MSEKDVIIGLISLKEHRGLEGPNPRETWMVEAIAVLLRAELERQKEKRDGHD